MSTKNKNNNKKIILQKSKLSSIYLPLGVTILIAILSLLIVYFSGIFLGLGYFGSDMQGKMINQSFLFERTLVNTLASLMTFIVLYTYVSLYMQTKSKFSLGLIVVAIALLVQTLTANPWILNLFGFRLAGAGLFSLVSSIATLIAVSILLYLSRN